jgi:hypothetical protein
MTGKEIVTKILKTCRKGHDNDPVTFCRGCLHAEIDAALAEEREAVSGLVSAIEEYLIAPATTSPEQLRKALIKSFALPSMRKIVEELK